MSPRCNLLRRTHHFLSLSLLLSRPISVSSSAFRRSLVDGLSFSFPLSLSVHPFHSTPLRWRNQPPTTSGHQLRSAAANRRFLVVHDELWSGAYEVSRAGPVSRHGGYPVTHIRVVDRGIDAPRRTGSRIDAHFSYIDVRARSEIDRAAIAVPIRIQ